jgi:molybdate transport repressor ModE-like protein
MLEVRRMRVLREIAEQGSLTAAAETLACTQSAVSQQLAALERELGVELVERHRGRGRLTHAGELLVGHVEAVLERIERAEATLVKLRWAVTGSLDIAAFSTAAAAILPTALGTFAVVLNLVAAMIETLREVTSG